MVAPTCLVFPLYQGVFRVDTQKSTQANCIIACVPMWQGKKASNPRPTVLETAALPAELFPCIVLNLMVDRQGLEPRTDRL